MLCDQMAEWNRTSVAYPRDKTIADLFMQQVALTPDAIAVVYKEVQLSYRELGERSSRLALHLQCLGVKAETLVGVCLKRSENLVVSLIAILKAGGAYVPLDPAHPQARLSLVIEDSGMDILLASTDTRELLPGDRSGIAVVDVAKPFTSQELQPVTATPATGSNLAYVMYTSGSTGQPKGVMVEHRNVVNFFAGMDRAIGSDTGVWLAVTSFAFDISVLELLWTVTRGFTVVILGDGDTGEIAEEIVRRQVTHLQMTPSLARMLTMDARGLSALAGLRKVLLGGEALPSSLVHRIRQVFEGELYNMYGPTETTIWSTTYKIAEVGETVPIGRPIANTGVYVVDDTLHPVKQGGPGELWIGGDGVARGYLHRPKLTAERFVEAPALSSKLIYRTGDLVRMAANGNLEFLGRADYQVKLRGNRIELGEIEAALERCAGVNQAIVVLREDRPGDQRLIAYLVADSNGTLSPGMLQGTLTRTLPEVMIPSAFIPLPAMPLTDNGKIDRKALLKLPAPLSSTSPNQSDGVDAECSEMECIVAKVWREALGTPVIGLNDNFFDLGAHSLTVAEVQSKLQNSLGRDISLVDLFQFTTVSALASHLMAMAPVHSPTHVSARALRRKLARHN